jgi:hypothetical protein
LKLVAKTEVVHENPGDEKGFLRRVADTLNPFSSSGNGEKEDSKPESAVELLAKRAQAQKKDQSGGIFSSLWPFGASDAKKTRTASTGPKADKLVNQIDQSLAQEGIDSSARQAALKPPPADLPNTDDLAESPPAQTNTLALLTAIDSDLKKSGKNAAELPPPPEIAEAFKDTGATQSRAAKPVPNAPQPPQNIQSSGILSSIDEKLKAKGVEPAQFEQPPSAEKTKVPAAQQPQLKNVEIEPKVTLEKGPLFLNPTDVPAQEKTPSTSNVEAKKSDDGEPGAQAPSRVLVKGPVQPQMATAGSKPAETNRTSSTSDDEPKGVLDQIRQDVESASKVLNPFQW